MDRRGSMGALDNDDEKPHRARAARSSFVVYGHIRRDRVLFPLWAGRMTIAWLWDLPIYRDPREREIEAAADDIATALKIDEAVARIMTANPGISDDEISRVRLKLWEQAREQGAV
jgi:hypothetical protein